MWRMSRETTVIKLRTKLSHLLFEHKEKMQENTYKILSESLTSETENEPTEKVWCAITYVKATLIHETNETIPDLNAHRRNIPISPHMFETTKSAMGKQLSKTCTFHNILPHDDEDMKEYLSKELDEPELFNEREAKFRIISIVQLE